MTKTGLEGVNALGAVIPSPEMIRVAVVFRPIHKLVMLGTNRLTKLLFP